MVKMKLLNFFEFYELQWSRLLHFRSGMELDYWRIRNGKKKKDKIVRAEMGYCPFSKTESQHSRLSRHTAS